MSLFPKYILCVLNDSHTPYHTHPVYYYLASNCTTSSVIPSSKIKTERSIPILLVRFLYITRCPHSRHRICSFCPMEFDAPQSKVNKTIPVARHSKQASLQQRRTNKRRRTCAEITDRGGGTGSNCGKGLACTGSRGRWRGIGFSVHCGRCISFF